MRYFDGNTVTALWNYTQFFVMSDNSFGTTFGPSTPGLMNLVAGQTNGVAATLNGTGNEVSDGNGGLTVIGDVDGKNVIMVDDLTETAGTLTNAATLLKKYGAKDIYTGVSHAVFTDIAHERLIKSEIQELITTDSTPVRLHPDCNITVLSIAEVLAEGIHRIYTNESVSSLFEINAKQS